MLSRRELVAAAFLARASGQPAPDARLRVTGRLVLVPATVMDADHRLVRDIPPAEFLLLDRGVRQDFAVDQETMPVSLVIAVEATLDARKALAKLRDATSLFGPLVVGEGGRIGLVAVRDEAQTIAPLTPDVDAVMRQLRRLPAKGGGWSFVDGVMHCAALLRSAPPNHRKVVLVIGEARDRTSRTDLGQAISLLEREHVTVYALTYSPVLMDFGREVVIEPDT